MSDVNTDMLSHITDMSGKIKWTHQKIREFYSTDTSRMLWHHCTWDDINQYLFKNVLQEPK